MASHMDPAFVSQMALTKAALDHQLSPSRSAKDATGVLEQMIAATRLAKDNPSIAARSDIPYGPRARQRLDIFRPADAPRALPCLVFIHGGFWQEGDKSVSGFAAQTFTGMQWAYVSVGYTLTPEITLREVLHEIRDAVVYLHENADVLGIDPARIVIAGHSAGGHLAASVLAGISGPEVPAMIAGAVLISGVFELAPIAASYVSDLTPMTAVDVATLSPLRCMPARPLCVHVLIGADEPAAFQLQSDVLIARWQSALPSLTRHTAQGRDHFDVLFDLTDPCAPTMQHILSMV